MFSVFSSSKEKPIISIAKENETQLMKTIFLVYRLVYIFDSMDEFRQLSLRNIVVSS